jgi:hypothetical protein
LLGLGSSQTLVPRPTKYHGLENSSVAPAHVSEPWGEIVVLGASGRGNPRPHTQSSEVPKPHHGERKHDKKLREDGKIHWPNLLLLEPHNSGVVGRSVCMCQVGSAFWQCVALAKTPAVHAAHVEDGTRRLGN